MRQRLSVVVVGCGTAGAAAALFLRRQGHRVTVLEQVAQPGAVGAGIILQPSGQAVLRCLGVHETVFAAGEPLQGLTVLKAAGARVPAVQQHAGVDRAPLMALRYDDVPGDHLGLGLHRGVLFQTLFDAVRREDIDLRLGVVGQDLARERALRWVVTPSGERIGPFDLVVVADGSRSKFRDDTQLTTRADPYPWGALWFMADDAEHRFRDELFQVVQGTGILIGLLPTGFDVSGRRKVSFFFSVRANRAAEVRAMDVADFRAMVCRVVPEAEPVLAQLGSCADLLYSGYFDIVMSTWHTRAVVHLGDAAHATSPQLGQGANLALYDAYVLSEAIRAADDVPRALDAYSRARRAHLGYYQLVTRWLTPFFQSDYHALGAMRDLGMPLLAKVGLFRRAMVWGMCGMADGHPWAQVPLPSDAQRIHSNGT